MLVQKSTETQKLGWNPCAKAAKNSAYVTGAIA
ncbi:hypothetical protein RD1_3139 [Roseobacter denitrificans OCh 114]|uniref:Uncharacterized protein n=1 Tax=Roseobacter denitrificans (strain ATCC 33942 / OCh 114) TaxID=375451 RepID=Q164E6_ROSDO|nr:hypothetical protein RD1_3139 [Roseobacter denitrificans OCh 114]